MASDSRVTGSGENHAPDETRLPAEPDARPAGPASESPEDQSKSQERVKRRTSRKEGREKPASKAAGPNALGEPTGQPMDEPPGAQPTIAPTGATAAVSAGDSPTGGAEGSEPTEPVAGEEAEQHHEGSSLLAGVQGHRFLLFNAVPSWMVSMIVHAVLLMILALLTMPELAPEQRIVAVANPVSLEEVENLAVEDIEALNVDVFEGAAPAEVVEVRTTTADVDLPSLDDMSAAPEQFKLEDFGDMAAPSDDLLDRIGGGVGEGLGDVRGAKARRAMVDAYGGSEGSEAAVAAALRWLAAHQMPDGGWHFDHTLGPCKGRCENPGNIQVSRNGATAMALLPFLGAGQTHKDGEYQQVVEQGLVFLMRSMKLGNEMGDLTDTGGRLYSHGLASITLCEAYAMTNDQTLLQPAQLSLNFIVYAQDKIGGGWRYYPHDPGDTSVLGWQLMACKSGHMAYLRVPRKTILGASMFLDFVQSDNGSRYGYVSPLVDGAQPGAGAATTAVGLLCRMYLGWKRDHPGLQAGVDYLHQLGPTDNMYYNYYATQVMRHYGGEYWEAWNARMRDRLVDSQDKRGHAEGSWYFPRGTYSSNGGRLYCTSLATMILEVYYRHMPIYGKQAAEEEFPL